MPSLAEVREKQAQKKAAEAATDPADDNDMRADEELETKLVEAAKAGLDSRSTLADQDDELNIVYYGDGGSGKTTAMCTMANLGPILVINAEKGLKRRALQRRGINVANITVIPDMAKGEKLSFDLLDDLFWELKEQTENGTCPYIGVVWDSITEISKVLVGDSIADRVDKARRTGRGSDDPFFTDLTDYNKMTEQLRTLVRRYRDLPMHFAASALERRDTDDDGKVLYRPDLTPAISRDVYGYVDIVCHTEVIEDRKGKDDDIFLGLFRPIGKYRAKDREGALPRRLADPTFERVLAYVDETLDVDNDPVQTETAARLKGNDDKSADE